MAPDEPTMRVVEPAAGTGGMLLATAQVLAARGIDPAETVWLAVEVDPVVAVCLAVNVHTWGLGPNVVIGCGNGLAEWLPQAERERAAGIQIAGHHRLLALAAEVWLAA